MSTTPDAAAESTLRVGNSVSGERETILEALSTYRFFLRYTVRGLTDEQAGARTTASELCLGGIIKHVTETERTWMEFVLHGPPAMEAGDGNEHALPDRTDEFRMTPADTLNGILEHYAEVAERTEEIIKGLPELGASQPLPAAPWFEPGAHWSARRVLLHLLAETAHHAGHADIIRESLDGSKTMG